MQTTCLLGPGNDRLNKGCEDTIYQYYLEEKQRIIDNCISCGICFELCKIADLTDLACEDSLAVQEAMYNFLAEGQYHPFIKPRLDNCMYCYGCSTGICPVDLDPLRFIQLAKHELISRGLATSDIQDPMSPCSRQRILASLQVTPDEYAKIMTASLLHPCDCLFFAGCNVYCQPDILLNALDIMQIVDKNAAFLPGLDYCCGMSHIYEGDLAKGADKAEQLLKAINAYKPQTLVLWCPTCLCMLKKTLDFLGEFPYEVISYSQFLSRNKDRLNVARKTDCKIAIHEPCKTAYTGLDKQAQREIIRLISEEPIELSRHGNNTACCGSGPIEDNNAFSRMRDARLDEADASGAEILSTACHYCTEVLVSSKRQLSFTVKNYTSLLAESLDLPRRESKYVKYMDCGNEAEIMRDASDSAAKWLFTEEIIRETINKTFCRG